MDGADKAPIDVCTSSRQTLAVGVRRSTGFRAEPLLEPSAHLAGGLPRERDGGQLLDGRTCAHGAHHSLDKGIRLSRACASEHELILVEGGADADPLRCVA
jgi:hypothetical protein